MVQSKDARSERSRLALIKAGMTLLAETRDASLSDVAQAAGVGRATLYRHFETREQLIDAVAQHCLTAFDVATAHIDQQAKSHLDAVRMLFDVVMPMQEEVTFLMKLDGLIEDNQHIADLYQRQDEELRELFIQCQREQSIRADVPVDWLMTMIDGLFFAAWRMIVEHNASHQDAARLAFDSFCRGVKHT